MDIPRSNVPSSSKFTASSYPDSGVFINKDESGALELMIVYKNLSSVWCLKYIGVESDYSTNKEILETISDSISDLEKICESFFDNFERTILTTRIEELENEVKNLQENNQSLLEKNKILKYKYETYKELISEKLFQEWVTGERLEKIIKLLLNNKEDKDGKK